MATSERTHTKEGGLDMTALDECARHGRRQGCEVQVIGDRVVVNPRIRLAEMRDAEGRVIETVRLSLEVCACGYSYARPGVGYAGPDGWYCKRCGQLHTLDEGAAVGDAAHLKPSPALVREFDKRVRVSPEWATAGDLEAIQ